MWWIIGLVIFAFLILSVILGLTGTTGLIIFSSVVLVVFILLLYSGGSDTGSSPTGMFGLGVVMIVVAASIVAPGWAVWVIKFYVWPALLHLWHHLLHR